MTLTDIKKLTDKTLQLRTDLIAATKFRNKEAERRLHLELTANNAVVVDALIDYLERNKHSGGDTEIGVAVDRNVNVIKHPAVDPNSGNGRWNK